MPDFNDPVTLEELWQMYRDQLQLPNPGGPLVRELYKAFMAGMITMQALENRLRREPRNIAVKTMDRWRDIVQAEVVRVTDEEHAENLKGTH